MLIETSGVSYLAKRGMFSKVPLRSELLISNLHDTSVRIRNFLDDIFLSMRNGTEKMDLNDT